MSERILEIAFKLFNEDEQSDPGTYIQLNVEKFAELLIAECVNVILLDGKKIADEMPMANKDNYTMVAEQTGMINASIRYTEKVKEHFGI